LILFFTTPLTVSEETLVSLGPSPTSFFMETTSISFFPRPFFVPCALSNEPLGRFLPTLLAFCFLSDVTFSTRFILVVGRDGRLTATSVPDCLSPDRSSPRPPTFSPQVLLVSAMPSSLALPSVSFSQRLTGFLSFFYLSFIAPPFLNFHGDLPRPVVMILLDDGALFFFVPVWVRFKPQ